MKCISCTTRWKGSSLYCPECGSPVLQKRHPLLTWSSLTIAVAVIVWALVQ